ncbi:hypothetical protein [Curtobacterium sp. RRHDQ10]|uniref:hypothetical protein n=1 Tax=Curtobacterium phyllosphaerae TaxID=3413379 RepID=UPI003BF0FF19
MNGNASFADLSAHRTRSNVRPAAVRVETVPEGIEIVDETASAEPTAHAFVTA